ncbi:MAG: Hpt domain-containing protein [Desulfobulbaceae bacterium]|jgi:HPt (histidine-containing phosphotransfer) domain-containing protein|nr:Hpt domain-containing protein [Desulfobulbaceae bacterium]
MTELNQRIRVYLTATFHFSDEQLSQMLPGFFDTLRGHLAAVEQSIAGDSEELSRAAHTLKGALLNLGLEPEAALALELEERGMDSAADRGDLSALARRLRMMLAAL